jgi:hypothetical protein
MGFEPTYDGFANHCLTAWLPHRGSSPRILHGVRDRSSKVSARFQRLVAGGFGAPYAEPSCAEQAEPKESVELGPGSSC